jgi:hypothetical protein
MPFPLPADPSSCPDHFGRFRNYRRGSGEALLAFGAHRITAMVLVLANFTINVMITRTPSLRFLTDKELFLKSELNFPGFNCDSKSDPCFLI